MSEKYNDHLKSVLTADARLVDEQGDLMLNKIKDFANNLDETLLDILLADDQSRDKFFIKIKEVFVFKQREFIFFLEQNSLDNSFTNYANRIGLTLNGKFLKDNTDVVLDFPYKDCVLEGGQSTEEGADVYFEYDDKAEEYTEGKSKRKEIFYNNIIAKDEIDRLFEPKAFENILRYDKEGKTIPVKFTRDENGNITDNLIIKGNNLLALHSLQKEFKGKVKLIYIDPPYNTGSDDFKYNDNFNHSTWLTFMMNRLLSAKDLLSEDGAIYIHIDHHQLGYLNNLADSIFGKENKVQVISVKTASPAGFKTVNPGPIDVTEYILFYTKNKPQYTFRKGYVKVGYNKNYNLFVEKNNDVKKWSFTPIKEKVLKDAGFNSEKEAKEKFGSLWPNIFKVMVEDFAYNNADNIVSIRDPHKPTEKVKQLMNSSKNVSHVIEYVKGDDSPMYIYKGGALAFYSNKMKKIDGKLEVTELLTDFWNHISWAGIAKEGGVKLKNGKKPEKLLKQIFELSTNEGDIVLDYHLGSGTTAATAHKMKRQYIGIEQLEYGNNDAIIRLQNVVNGDQSGISKSVNWKSGDSFIYMELAKNNQKAIDLIQSTESFEELERLFTQLYDKYFLHYNVRIQEFKNEVLKEDNFLKLPIEKQKEMFIRMLDNNQLYVNVDDIEDTHYGLNPEDIRLTKDFYQINE